MVIDGIPDYVDWDMVETFLRSLGIDPFTVTAEGVRFGYATIECSVYALNEQGRRYYDPAVEAVATHRVSIEIRR